ncbi:MAG: T9SS type A sorting domain-containing protein [Chloroflexia bacterium]|nr:T9SS type A sorting domain-containing protein [Chloroflexia bacterium]
MGYNSTTNYTNKPITIAVQSGPGTISGTLTKTSSSGSASFNGIKFSAPGVYVLTASDSTLSARSIQITVTPKSTALDEKDNTIYSVKCFPNPLQNTTTFAFDLKENSNVWLSVNNVAGQEISSLNLGSLQSGKHEYRWNVPMGLSAGLYFYQIKTHKGFYVGKLLINP